jgi:prephenate dehydratase
MTTTNELKTAALGGPSTFNGAAAVRLREMYPALGQLTYFSTIDQVWQAFDSGAVDAVVMPSETTRTGFSDLNKRVASAEAPLYVIGEADVYFSASLIAKRGTRLEDVRRVLGHGMSTAQSRPWLERNLPGVEVVIHPVNSVEAAKELAAGDGASAVIGTPETAQLTGLVEIAKDIDGGSVGSFWAVSTKPAFNETPQRLIVAGRLDAEGQLGGLVEAVAKAGFQLETAHSEPTGNAVHEYYYVLRFRGDGQRSEVERALASAKSVRLVGAFRIKS